MDQLQRRSQRVTATMSWQLHQRLQQRADEEGRSLSNLIAHILEANMAQRSPRGRRHAALKLIALAASKEKDHQFG
jgi:hypothetical protein